MNGSGSLGLALSGNVSLVVKNQPGDQKPEWHDQKRSVNHAGRKFSSALRRSVLYGCRCGEIRRTSPNTYLKQSSVDRLAVNYSHKVTLLS